jgi:hypothetical protein
MKFLKPCKLLIISFLLTGNILLAQEQTPENKNANDSLPSLEEYLQKQKVEAKSYFLSLEKPSGKRRVRYYQGDELHFKLKGDKYIYHTRISDFQADGIIINEALIPLSQIKSIIVYNRSGLFKQAKRLIPKAGIVFIALDMVNPIITRGENLKVQTQSVLIGGAITAAGLALNLFNKRTYHLNKVRYLRILEKY